MVLRFKSLFFISNCAIILSLTPNILRAHQHEDFLCYSSVCEASKNSSEISLVDLWADIDPLVQVFFSELRSLRQLSGQMSVMIQRGQTIPLSIRVDTLRKIEESKKQLLELEQALLEISSASNEKAKKGIILLEEICRNAATLLDFEYAFASSPYMFSSAQGGLKGRDLFYNRLDRRFALWFSYFNEIFYPTHNLRRPTELRYSREDLWIKY